MTRLVADIGGTNARLALAEGHEVLPGTQQRLRNDAHSGFDEVAELYLADHADHRVTEIVAAIAGPVSPEEGRLTNRGWVLRTDDLCRRFGVDRAVLVNDLAALGYALPALGPDELLPVLPGHLADHADQALVAGIGTGFNVSQVLYRDGVASCGRAECGHLSVPGSIALALRDRLGTEKAADYVTVEDCFSGRGLARMFADMTGRSDIPAQEILATDRAAGTGFSAFYATLTGLLARELRLIFMPDAGLYFAGSVARELLTGDDIAAFEAAFTTATTVNLPPAPPVRIIRDDMAALKGCALV